MSCNPLSTNTQNGFVRQQNSANSVLQIIAIVSDGDPNDITEEETARTDLQ
jgi:uncharacterized protein (UPF0297 family)